jgi:hypothetical protein
MPVPNCLPANGLSRVLRLHNGRLFRPGLLVQGSVLVLTLFLGARSRAEGPDKAPADGEPLLELPRPEQLFRVESEAEFRRRLRAEGRRRQVQVEFPRDDGVAPGAATGPGRALPPQVGFLAPSYVCYQPLYFEDKNSERYGWTVPLAQPLISAGKFYLDTLLLPCHLVAQPPCTCECNTGYPLPGDCVPYFIYLPTWSRALSLMGPAGRTDIRVGGCSVYP